MNKKPFLLLFPPLWDVDSPYLGLTSLTAYLRQRDVTTIQRDLNIEYYDEVLSGEYLLGLEAKLRAITKSEEVLQAHRIVTSGYLTVLPLIAKEIDVAKQMVKRFAGFQAARRAKSFIHTARLIVSAVHYPSWGETDRYNSVYDCRRLSEVLRGAKSRKDNLFREFFENKLKKILNESSPFAIGISLTAEAQLIPAFTLADVIKSLAPNTPIVLGGAMMPYMVNAMKVTPETFSFVDFVVSGEGETPLFLLCRHLSGNGDLACVPNLIFRSNSSEIVTTAAHLEDVNCLPVPDSDGLQLDRYCHPEAITILTSRGCYWDRCAFCSLTGNYLNAYRERRLDLVVGEIEERIAKSAVRYVQFHDECISPIRLACLLAMLEERKLAGNFWWYMLGRFDKGFELDLCRRAYSAGLRLISWGLESASPTVLSRMKKGIVVDNVEAGLRNSHEAGILNNVFVMWHFPGETDEEAEETLRFILRNKEYIDSLSMASFRLEGGSDVWKNPQKYGIEIKPTPGDFFGPRYPYAEQQEGGVQWEVSARIHRATTSREAKMWQVTQDLHCHAVQFAGADAYHLLEPVCTNVQGKQALRAHIRDNMAWARRLREHAARLDVLTLSIPDYVRVLQVLDAPLVTDNDIVVFNGKTGLWFMTNKGTVLILQCLDKPMTFPILLEKVKQRAYPVSPEVVERDCRKLCSELVRYEFLHSQE